MSAKPRIRIKEHVVVRAGDLLPNPANWRIHPPAQVEAMRAIIGELGHIAEALAVRTRRGLMLVDGHLRQSLDPDADIPVAILDLTPAEARRALATYDVIGEMSERDDPKFLELLDRADASTEEFRRVLVQFEANANGASKAPRGRRRIDPDDQPVVEKGRAKPGDLWQLGPHRILCGDTTRAEDVDRLMGDARADLTLTDPPYAIYGSSTGIGSDMSDDKMVRPFFLQILEVTQERSEFFAHAYIFCDWRSWPSWWEMAKRARLTPKNLLVWDKGGSGLGSSYANTYELVAFFAKLPKQTVMTSGFKRGQRTVHASNVIRHNKVPGAEREHNAAKPVGVLAHLIENSSDKGDLVVDWFAGSGSTLIACEQTERRCYTMEIDPRYVDITIKRWEKFAAQKAVLLDEGAARPPKRAAKRGKRDATDGDTADG